MWRSPQASRTASATGCRVPASTAAAARSRSCSLAPLQGPGPSAVAPSVRQVYKTSRWKGSQGVGEQSWGRAVSTASMQLQGHSCQDSSENSVCCPLPAEDKTRRCWLRCRAQTQGLQAVTSSSPPRLVSITHTTSNVTCIRCCAGISLLHGQQCLPHDRQELRAWPRNQRRL